MGQKQCEKCGETVDEAKAFCPACGHAFVEEEKRLETSAYERMDSTVQFGQTVYNMMLSDMGLNITKPPDPAPTRVEVLAPAAAPAAERQQPKPAAKPAEKPQRSSNTKWLIVGGVILVLVFFFIVAAGAAGYVYWTQFRSH